jgi:hypothetical protein
MGESLMSELNQRQKRAIERQAKAILKRGETISDGDFRFALMSWCSQHGYPHDRTWIDRCIDKARNPHYYKRPRQGYGFR